MRNSKTYLIATLLSGVAFAGPAYAQTAPASGSTQDPSAQPAATQTCPDGTVIPAASTCAAAPSSSETIVVTGSRIASPNIVALAPVQVVGEQEIKQSGAVNIQEILDNNPAFGSPVLSTTTTAFLTSGAGVATVNLRNLGDNRTLVLINNRRVVGGIQGSPVVDLNNIPTQFLERVDILTGGESALYGSDAVAGVVNFIYKRNFEGLLAEGQYGLTEQGDAQRYQISATAGGNFMDGRGNIMVHVGYTNDKGLLSRERKNTRIDDLSQMFYTGDPKDYGVSHQPYFSSFPPQGRFTTGGKTFTFGPTGQLQPCFTTNFASCGGGAGQGPNGFNRQFFRTLSTPVARYLFAERSRFDVTDNISFITEATYAKVHASSVIEPFPLDSSNINPVDGTVPIQAVAGGPCFSFVPTAICAAASDQNHDGLKDISFRRRLADIGNRTADANRNFFRLVTGFEGSLLKDRFHWDVGYNFGETTEQQHSTGQINVQNFLSAITDCQDPIAVAEGCVPLSIFGLNSITPAAAAFVSADQQHTFKVKQQVWDANINGSLIDLPGGPLGVALGAEYRKESSNEDWDALTNEGLNGGNALPDTKGSFNVKEAFAEVNLPILKDLPFAKQLNLRGAGRISDYSTVGSATTWSIGGDWAPVEDIRFRATLAKAIRAPNIGELFTGPSQTFPVGLQDPCEKVGLTGNSPNGGNGDLCRASPGVLANINANVGNVACPTAAQATGCFILLQADKQGVSGFNGGNPNLKAEKAKTFTAGVVITPRSIPALRNMVLSVDYWRINITDAIILTSRQLILNTCFDQGLAASCALITRFPAAIGASSSGALRFVNDFSINAAVLRRSGIDTVFTYRTGLGTFMGSPLNVNARVAYTHLLTGFNIPLPNQQKDRVISEIGNPKDKFNATLGFDNRLWGLTFTGTYIGKSHEDEQFLSSVFGLGPNAVTIHPIFYLDGQIRFTPSKTYEFFVGANNLTNVQAPNILSGSPFNTTGSDTDEAVYDVFGRRYYAGARLRF